MRLMLLSMPTSTPNRTRQSLVICPHSRNPMNSIAKSSEIKSRNHPPRPLAGLSALALKENGVSMVDHSPTKVDAVPVCLGVEGETMEMVNTTKAIAMEITTDVPKAHRVRMGHMVLTIEAHHLNEIMFRMATVLDHRTINHAPMGPRNPTMMAMLVVLKLIMASHLDHLSLKITPTVLQMRLHIAMKAEDHHLHDLVSQEVALKALILVVPLIHTIEIHTSRHTQAPTPTHEVFHSNLVEEMTAPLTARAVETANCSSTKSRFVTRMPVRVTLGTGAAHMSRIVVCNLL